MREMNIVIEMKNGVEISGIIEECDSNMNLTMHHVRQVSSRGDVKNMDVAFVSGSSILYVHLPPGNIRRHVKDHVSLILFFLFMYVESFVVLTVDYSFNLLVALSFFPQNLKETYRRKKARGGNKKA